MKKILAACALASLMGCSTAFYDEAPEGYFQGSLLVLWIENTDGDGTGDGKFVYIPDEGYGNSLTFYRGTRPDGSEPRFPEIKPEWMYTDGGSIPTVAQGVKGLNPWGYAPAYMVHDWLFVAQKCMTDGKATDAEKTLEGMTFVESFEIMAEMIKTLEASNRISPGDVQPRAISWAVSQRVSEGLWNAEGACDANRITEVEKKLIAGRLGYDPETGKRVPRVKAVTLPPSGDGLDEAVIELGPEPVQVISRITF